MQLRFADVLIRVLKCEAALKKTRRRVRNDFLKGHPIYTMLIWDEEVDFLCDYRRCMMDAMLEDVIFGENYYRLRDHPGYDFLVKRELRRERKAYGLTGLPAMSGQDE